MLKLYSDDSPGLQVYVSLTSLKEKAIWNIFVLLQGPFYCLSPFTFLHWFHLLSAHFGKGYSCIHYVIIIHLFHDYDPPKAQARINRPLFRGIQNQLINGMFDERPLIMKVLQLFVMKSQILPVRITVSTCLNDILAKGDAVSILGGYFWICAYFANILPSMGSTGLIIIIILASLAWSSSVRPEAWRAAEAFFFVSCHQVRWHDGVVRSFYLVPQKEVVVMCPILLGELNGHWTIYRW